MTRSRHRSPLAILVVVCGAATASAPCLAAQPADDSGRFSADRPIDFLTMRLALEFTDEGLAERKCTGRVEYEIESRRNGVTELTLDAVEMRIAGVSFPGESAPAVFSHDDRRLTIQLPEPLARGERRSVSIEYELHDPSKGMYFILPNASVPEKPLMVYTMSEPLEARYWFPTHDWPNERWTSEFVVTVPAKYSVVANGELVAKTAADGERATYHWRHDVPTDPHLLGLVVGELEEVREDWRGKPVRVYAHPRYMAAARHSFRRVPQMLEYYTTLLGVDYPYPGYSHIVVEDHHHGGMEHAGFSFLSPNLIAASDDGDVVLDDLEAYYVAHMLTHQWFAGIVNYRSLPEAWLNEGFATYLDTLWTSQGQSQDFFERRMHGFAQSIAANDTSERGTPMVNRSFSEAGDVYEADGGKIYFKGAWVLHMLAQQLGEDVFWPAVAGYLEQHRGEGVETADLRDALESASGLDLDRYFQQWVYGRGVPRLAVDYLWDGGSKRATVTIRQTQKIDDETPAFAFPLKLAFMTSGGETRNRTVEIGDARQEFSWEFDQEPIGVCLDPSGVLLATFELSAPRAMILEAAQRGPTFLSRLRAVEKLASENDPTLIEPFSAILADATQPSATREESAGALGRFQTSGALDALLGCEQSGMAEPRVLAAVVSALANFPISTKAHSVVLKHAVPKSNVRVESAATSALSRMNATPELAEQSLVALLKAVNKPTRRTVRQSAIFALRGRDDPRVYDTLLAIARPAQGDELRTSAIRALGPLGRAEDRRGPTRDLLIRWLSDPDREAQQAAIQALGNLGDAKAISDLMRLSQAARGDSQRQTIRQAIDSIQSAARGDGGGASLTDRLESLETENHQLKQSYQELLKRLEAIEKATSAPRS